MHGSAQGQHNVGNVLVDTGGLSSLHVGGDGGNGGAGAEGNGCGLEQMPEHDLYRTLAAAETGIDGEEDEHIHKAQAVVQQQRTAVVTDQLGTVVGYQIGEEAEETDGGIVSNDLDGIHNAGSDVFQQPGSHGFGTTLHLNTEAENDSKDDQGQNSPAAQQLHKVGLGEEADDHIPCSHNLAGISGRHIVGAGNNGKDADNSVHNEGSNGGGDGKGTQGSTHDLTGPLHAGHIGNGGGDGAEYHGNHQTEHHVGKQFAQGLQIAGKAGPQQTNHAAAGNAKQHTDNKGIVF